MNTPQKFWRYKGINHRLEITEGIERASSFVELCIIKRQQQIQIIEAIEIQDSQWLAEQHLCRMHRLLAKLNHQSKPKYMSNTLKNRKQSYLKYLLRKFIG